MAGILPVLRCLVSLQECSIVCRLPSKKVFPVCSSHAAIFAKSKTLRRSYTKVIATNGTRPRKSQGGKK
jgi:hypothetical protein